MDYFIHKMVLVMPIFQDCHEAGKRPSLLSTKPGALKMLTVWYLSVMLRMTLEGHHPGFLGRGPCKVNSRGLEAGFPDQGFLLYCCSPCRTESGVLGQRQKTQNSPRTPSSSSGVLPYLG